MLIGLQFVARRLRLGLEGPQRAVGEGCGGGRGGRDRLRLIVELRGKRVGLGACPARLALARAGGLVGRVADLAVDAAELSGEVLHARMERQQGARRVGDLRLERGALIGEPPKRRVGDRRTCIGDLRFAFEPTQQCRSGGGRGLRGARFGKLRIEVGQRIAGWRRRFAARGARLRADRVDLCLGVGDPAFPVRDLLSEPGLDRARRFGPGFVPGLHDEICDRIRAARGKPRIARNEGDRDRARARRRRNRQPRQERLDGAAVGRASAARKPQPG